MAQDPHRVGRTGSAVSWPLLGLAGSAAIASIALVPAALEGSPYLGSSLNPWIAVFAIAAFAALVSVPFLANERIVASDPERDEAWERALVVWGAVALGVLATGVVVISG